MSCHGSLMDKYLKELYLIVFFILLKNITTIGYHVDTHRVAKRMNLESCLGQFDVHRDTIIRTEESLSIGGKYLQGVSIETSEECQHLCCETENCDVYIFEGKGGGYCYLFECGPPENFRCKFTRHTNYTSAVLTPIRHVTEPPTVKPPPPPPQAPAQLNPQILLPQSLSQHELELTNLKQKPDNANISVGKTTSTPLPPPLGVRVAQITTTPRSVSATSSVCGRFQFQCHSGECIAVYNACDGIPQCEDGSDEGPECPGNSGVGNKPSLPGLKTEEIPMEQNSRPQLGDGIGSMSKQPAMQSVPRAYQQAVMQPPNINNREDPMSAPPIWPNRKIQDTQDIEHNSRIFNHKGGIQIASNSLSQPYSNPVSSLYNSIQRDMYMQPDYQVSYHNPIILPQDHMIQTQNINWQQQSQQQQQSLLPGGPYIAAVNGQPVPQIKAVPVQQEQLVNVPVPGNHQQPGKPEQSVIGPTAETSGKDKHSPKHDQNSNESDAYEEYEEKSTEAPKKKLRKHKKPLDKDGKAKNHGSKSKTEKPADSPVHEQYKMIKNSLEMEFVDHDGQSERPGGAVLSLTLGIIVTAALAVLVGCRMRTVGRRVRRAGKAPYSHDADFLVNGMYL